MDTGHALFALTISPLELFVRGSAVYWFLFAIFRIVLRRDIGAVGIADVLLIVLVADAAQNAMAGEYRSISDGLVLVSTIVGWNVAIDWLAYSVPSLRGVFEARPLLLVRDGHFLAIFDALFLVQLVLQDLPSRTSSSGRASKTPRRDGTL